MRLLLPTTCEPSFEGSMDLMNAQYLYKRSPVLLQNAACSYIGWREASVRFGDEFHHRLAFLSESEKWSATEIEAYQNAQLRKLIRHAYETVPYYRDQMKKCGVTPEDVQKRSDLAKLPILTKEDVRHNLGRLVSERASKG